MSYDEEIKEIQRKLWEEIDKGYEVGKGFAGKDGPGVAYHKNAILEYNKNLKEIKEKYGVD